MHCLVSTAITWMRGGEAALIEPFQELARASQRRVGQLALPESLLAVLVHAPIVAATASQALETLYDSWVPIETVGNACQAVHGQV
jgi:hypothetical protein